MMKRGVLLVFSNPLSPDASGAFNTWYDETHLPEFLRVPGVVAARRFERSLHQRSLPPGEDLAGRNYLATYEVEAEDFAALLDVIASTAGDRTHSGLLERDPPPLMLLFEQIGEAQTE